MNGENATVMMLTHKKANGNAPVKEAEQMLIEKGIPITNHNPASKYPWSKMEVGDSFYAKISPDSLRGSANNQTKRTGKKFVVRAEGHGARAWRVE